MATLEQLVASVPQDEQATVDVDISDVVGAEPGTIVFRFGRPSVSTLYIAQRDAERIKLRHADWDLNLCATVAFLGLCYAGDREGPPTLAFETLVERNMAAWIALATRAQAAIPGLDLLRRVTEGTADAGESSAECEDGSCTSASATCTDTPANAAAST